MKGAELKISDNCSLIVKSADDDFNVNDDTYALKITTQNDSGKEQTKFIKNPDKVNDYLSKEYGIHSLGRFAFKFSDFKTVLEGLDLANNFKYDFTDGDNNPVEKFKTLQKYAALDISPEVSREMTVVIKSLEQPTWKDPWGTKRYVDTSLFYDTCVGMQFGVNDASGYDYFKIDSTYSSGEAKACLLGFFDDKHSVARAGIKETTDNVTDIDLTPYWQKAFDEITDGLIQKIKAGENMDATAHQLLELSELGDPSNPRLKTLISHLASTIKASIDDDTLALDTNTPVFSFLTILDSKKATEVREECEALIKSRKVEAALTSLTEKILSNENYTAELGTLKTLLKENDSEEITNIRIADELVYRALQLTAYATEPTSITSDTNFISTALAAILFINRNKLALTGIGAGQYEKMKISIQSHFSSLPYPNFKLRLSNGLDVHDTKGAIQFIKGKKWDGISDQEIALMKEIGHSKYNEYDAIKKAEDKIEELKNQAKCISIEARLKIYMDAANEVRNGPYTAEYKMILISRIADLILTEMNSLEKVEDNFSVIPANYDEIDAIDKMKTKLSDAFDMLIFDMYRDIYLEYKRSN